MRPSQLLNITDDYVAYCLDEAVAKFGNHVVDELNAIEGKNPKTTEQKRTQKLHKLLGIERKFADPALRSSKRG